MLRYTLALPRFNQTRECFSCGNADGFAVYSVDPVKEVYRRKLATTDGSSHAGIGIVTMLFRSNLLALVGGGANPRWPRNVVMIWDDRTGACVAELSFPTAVRNVVMLMDVVAVALDSKVFVYRFQDLHLLEVLPTADNTLGLLSLGAGGGECGEDQKIRLACPALQQGSVQIITFAPIQKKNTATFRHQPSSTTPFNNNSSIQNKQQDGRPSIQHVVAHETVLGCLELRSDGLLLATASRKGTLIRIFSAQSGKLLREVRRGAEPADISSLVFHDYMPWFIVASAKGTVHVFYLPFLSTAPYNALSSSGRSSTVANPKSGLRFLSSLVPSNYFESEWSFAQLRVSEGPCVCAFLSVPHQLLALCADGSFTRAAFDPQTPGDMRKVASGLCAPSTDGYRVNMQEIS